MLVSTTAAPIAHAATEVLVAQPAWESGHSDACVELHVESRCLKGGGVYTDHSAGGSLLSERVVPLDVVPHGVGVVPDRPSPSQRFSRAPPHR